MRLTFICLIGLIALFLLPACAFDSKNLAPTPTYNIPLNDSELLSPDAENQNSTDLSSAKGGNVTIYPEIFSSDPILQTIARANWNDFILSAPVHYYSNNFYMLYTGVQNWSGSPAAIGWAKSDDGYTWEMASYPYMTPDQAPGSPHSVGASSLLIGDDSGRVAQWFLYYFTMEINLFDKSGAIGRATLFDPLVPPTPDEEYVLLPGQAGSWDELSVRHPDVSKTDLGYVMYYSGFDNNKQSYIGMATSEDGVNWTKFDNPQTIEAPFAESDPIFMGGSLNWNDSSPRKPAVLQLGPEQWLMAYTASPSQEGDSAVGLAFSKDGYHWLPVKNNPVITRYDFVEGSYVLDVHLATNGEVIFIYFIGVKSDNSTGVYLATIGR